MAKAYTDLDQSKKLAEILPVESADMCFNISQRTNMPPLMTPYCKFKEFFNMEETPDFLIPCWSLVALLDILNNRAYSIDEDASVSLSSYKTIQWYLGINNSDLEFISKDNPVDACYEMILKLHEQNLL